MFTLSVGDSYYYAHYRRAQMEGDRKLSRAIRKAITHHSKSDKSCLDNNKEQRFEFQHRRDFEAMFIEVGNLYCVGGWFTVHVGPLYTYLPTFFSRVLTVLSSRSTTFLPTGTGASGYAATTKKLASHVS